MADGFIVRKGGVVTEQAIAPTITEVSTTTDSITFTITNNDAASAVILWEVGDTTPDANSIELAAAATSGNLTVTGLDDDETYIVYATANVTGKVKSNVAELSIDTDALPVYTAATGGTTQEYDLDGKRYKSHTFNSNGDFIVSTVGDAAGDRNKVDYLIIAGGGSGGNSLGGGGGAGGYLTTLGATSGDVTANAKVTVTASTFAVVVGAGGTASSTFASLGDNGANSSVAFSTTITATGGGAATGQSIDFPNGPGGQNGGSGGGGARNNTSAGTGISGQGFGGGTGTNDTSLGGGGGGGASQVGGNASASAGGNGGNGLANLLRTGSNETRAGGGGGATRSDQTNPVGTGGTGGGTDGSRTGNASNATANTGSGGGGGVDGSDPNNKGGNGGSGIVVIRYEIAPSV